MRKPVSKALGSLIVSAVLIWAVIVLFQFLAGSQRGAEQPDVRTINEIVLSHQIKYGWRDEKIPLQDFVTLEGAAMNDETSHDTKKVYEFNVGGKYLAVFVYHSGKSVNGVHLASFGSSDGPVTELFKQLTLKTPTSLQGGAAMESWLGEQDAALKNQRKSE